LQDSCMPQDTRNAMEQEVFKIEQYASMVLEYLRIENMNSDLILRPCMLSEVTRKAVKKYATIFIHKRISLDMQELTSKVLTDDKWLSFVIEQLLSNALKYTAKGTIRIYEDKDLECRTCLVIEDSGIGIKEEDIERIFDKGYTGFNGRQNQKSSGIGLYLCKQVANKLSHNIKIESKVNQGTKVSIVFSNEYLEVY
ncbi:MAG TPA: ATP-binding protein, partial [Lachnospiraceae bacterium]|nr:ATP-binding protein [Lachnospiraceae bacterium]